MQINNQNKDFFVLRGAFDKDNKLEDIVNKPNIITEFISQKESFIYLGKEKDFSIKRLRKAIKSIVSNNHRGVNIDVKSFVRGEVDLMTATKFFIEDVKYLQENIWNEKTGKNKPKDQKEIILFNICNEVEKDSIETAEAINWTRNLQQMSPNKLNSINLANIVKKEFESKHRNVSVKVLGKPEIEKLGMNLLLAVNSGSKYDARVVALEYNGDNSSKEKTVMVGKGIIFDSGGYDIKTGGGLIGMKYDMSGSVIVAGAMKIISSAKPKANISALMVITDNKLSLNSTTPDSVVKSMSGKTVEISDTDAEGRLVLADGLTYAVKEMKATKLIDVATLTGTVVYQLGSAYSGVWTTNDKDFEWINKKAKEQCETIWRMPFNDVYAKGIHSSEVADLMNYSSKVKQDSQQAAMFLKEFTDKKPFIHLDIAGTADVGGKPTGVMVKTLGHLFS